MKKLPQKSPFHEFYKKFPYFFTFPSSSMTICQTFFSSIFVSQDAKLWGLSDDRFKFLERVWARVLMPHISLKLPFKNLDHLSLVRKTCMEKTYLCDNPNQPFCGKLFAASFETFLSIRRTENEREKISKYHQNMKKLDFLAKIWGLRVVITRSQLKVGQKILSFRIS